MKLIVGLGNPGSQYKDTLHNVGFAAIDRLAVRLSPVQWVKKFKGEMFRGIYDGFSFILLKPLTYMNVSGEAILACKQFFGIELRNMLVVSDDIDRPVGSLRYRASGGHGGHNGLRSIIQLCGGNDFHRIKIGIGRPEFGQEIASYVLSKPVAGTEKLVDNAINMTSGYLLDFIKGNPVQIEEN
ncbi:aminoacyl-tRNA hydrolase [bacterium]|nr:aminoacyl-tRNA hydrolase [bacterium]